MADENCQDIKERGFDMMKKRRLAILVVTFCFMLSCVPVYAAKIIGKAVNTDIVSYINGVPIKSYNVNGHTAIMAEDLSDYGMFVHYEHPTRELQIYTYFDALHPAEITAHYVPEKNTKPIGSFVANVYATDIVTTMDGKKIPSYNIGGRTLIFMDAFKEYGDLIWYPEERKVCFTSVPDWMYTINKNGANIQATDELGFSLELTKNAEGSFDVTGTNIEFLEDFSFCGGRDPKMYFDFALYDGGNPQSIATEEKLFMPMMTKNRGEWVSDDLTFSNAHMKVTINGKPFKITEVEQTGGNNHTDYKFTLDQNIRTLEEIQSIQIECQ